MKKVLVYMSVVLLVFISVISVLAASPAGDTATGANASVDEVGIGGYSVVSAVANNGYDFKNDFHDSYPYDEDFCTEGIFKMTDYDPAVTLTLKNNSTGEAFVYEKNTATEWYLTASVDHLLYEDTQIDGVLNIETLGSTYGIENTQVPVTIAVTSSLYSADFHKYPSYIANTVMYEGESYTIDYDAASSDHTATVTITGIPRIFELSLYNVETGQTEYYNAETGTFRFEEAEVPDYDPSCTSFWFFAPGTLVMDDGYELPFTLSVMAFPKKSTNDSAPASADSVGSADGTKNNNAVKTGDPLTAFIFALVCFIIAAGLLLYSRKRNCVR